MTFFTQSKTKEFAKYAKRKINVKCMIVNVKCNFLKKWDDLDFK